MHAAREGVTDRRGESKERFASRSDTHDVGDLWALLDEASGARLSAMLVEFVRHRLDRSVRATQGPTSAVTS